MNKNLKTINRLKNSLEDKSIDVFLNNYILQNNLPFSKHKRSLLLVYPELSKFNDIYFSFPFNFLESANRVRAFIVGGFEWLGDSIDYAEKIDYENFDKNFESAATKMASFYDGLTTLIKVYAHHNDVSPVELLEDDSLMRNIHQRISTPDSFLEMETARWDLYVSLLKILPETNNYEDFFNNVAVKSAEASQVMAGYAYNFDKAPEFVHVRVQEIAEMLIKSKKLDFSELKEGLKDFKIGYHDVVVKHFLNSYF